MKTIIFGILSLLGRIIIAVVSNDVRLGPQELNQLFNGLISVTSDDAALPSCWRWCQLTHSHFSLNTVRAIKAKRGGILGDNFFSSRCHNPFYGRITRLV